MLYLLSYVGLISHHSTGQTSAAEAARQSKAAQPPYSKVERETGLEPATLSLEG